MLLPVKKLTPRQVIRTILDDEDDDNDQDSQYFILNNENDLLLQQQPNSHLPASKEGSSNIVTTSFSFCNLSNSVYDGSSSTSSDAQSTPATKAPAIRCLKHS